LRVKKRDREKDRGVRKREKGKEERRVSKKKKDKRGPGTAKIKILANFFCSKNLR